MKKFSIGFILNLIACVLSLAAVIVYTMVMYKMVLTFVVLIAAIVLTVLALLQHIKGKHNLITELVAGCNSVLDAVALVAAVSLMVNQIGYVVASLDTIDTILAFIIFEVLVFLAMLLNIVASFQAAGKSVQ